MHFSIFSCLASVIGYQPSPGGVSVCLGSASLTGIADFNVARRVRSPAVESVRKVSTEGRANGGTRREVDGVLVATGDGWQEYAVIRDKQFLVGLFRPTDFDAGIDADVLQVGMTLRRELGTTRQQTLVLCGRAPCECILDFVEDTCVVSIANPNGVYRNRAVHKGFKLCSYFLPVCEIPWSGEWENFYEVRRGTEVDIAFIVYESPKTGLWHLRLRRDRVHASWNLFQQFLQICVVASIPLLHCTFLCSIVIAMEIPRLIDLSAALCASYCVLFFCYSLVIRNSITTLSTRPQNSNGVLIKFFSNLFVGRRSAPKTRMHWSSSFAKPARGTIVETNQRN